MRHGEPVRVRVRSVDDAGALVDADGVPGTIPPDELPYLRGAPADSLVGRRVAGLVVTGQSNGDGIVVSPRALAVSRCEALRERGRRAPVRVVARGEHGVLADAGGLRAWFPLEDPPRRALTLAPRPSGWVTAVGPHLAYLRGTERRAAATGAMTEVIAATVTDVDDAIARVRLEGASSGRQQAIVPRSEIAWHPVPSAAAELRPGDRVRGLVVDLGLDGPVLSLRAMVPSPWPAIALELAPGTPVRLRVRAVGERAALVRLVAQPHVAALVPRTDVAIGDVLTAVVGRVDVDVGRLHLDRVRSGRG